MSGVGDKRRSPRVPCDIPVEYTRTGTRPQDGRITNIGPGGALLTTQEAIQVETILVLRFQLPRSNRPIQTVGRVKWLNQQTVGVEFVGPPVPISIPSLSDLIERGYFVAETALLRYFLGGWGKGDALLVPRELLLNSS